MARLRSGREHGARYLDTIRERLNHDDPRHSFSRMTS
jgi:hypothetical protein